jgi:hypothetical protein
VQGGAALYDFGVRDLGGSLIHGGLASVDVATFGLTGISKSSLYEYSGNSVRDLKAIGSVIYDAPGYLAGGTVFDDVSTAYERARILSSYHTSGYARGATDPRGQIFLNGLTVGLSAAPRAGSLLRSASLIDNVPTPVGPANLRPVLADNVRFLRDNGITDRGLRRQIIEAGFRSDLLDPVATRTSFRQFEKLFPETVARGKQFRGRFGNIQTRVVTLNQGALLERAGFDVFFEHHVRLSNGNSRFIDIFAERPGANLPVAVQLVRTNPSGRIIRADELLAVQQIELGLSLPAGTVRTVNTNPSGQ